MKFKKSLNNNIALAEDLEGNELIVIGTGVGFKKVKGQELKQEDIKKRSESALTNDTSGWSNSSMKSLCRS